MQYPSIRIEGAIISAELISQLDGDTDMRGQKSTDFGLANGTRVKDDIAIRWADAQNYYRIYKQRATLLRQTDPGTSLTRNNWMVPLLGLFGFEIEPQSGLSINNQTYAISHRASNRANTPIYIIGANDPAGLDRKPANATRRMSAHAILQEYLNLSESLYGIVSNGRVLRVLRDSSRLVKQSYLEFDLERIFEDGLYADFAILYRLVHASRFPLRSEATAECLLERYHQDSLAAGARIRDGLAKAVEGAIVGFGNGFLQHPHNTVLHQQIDDGTLTPAQYYHLLLRLIYRLLFLMVIEERNLLFPHAATSADGTRISRHRNIYTQGYGLQRLRSLAEKHLEGSKRHTDLWQSLLATFRLFEADGKGQALSIMPLAGDLFNPQAIGILAECAIANHDLLHCVLLLSRYTPPKGVPTRVNYAALNVEEFGSVYEGLLGYTPIIQSSHSTRQFSFRELQGNDRKTSGSYYTPDSLVQAVLDSALNPVIAQAQQGKKPAEAARALRALRICEPAVGSGHFLLGAARRLADAIARADAEAKGESEYSPFDYQRALRDVIEHCVYGVDINPMSAELCRVALWIESHEPGKPLSFLDHHIQVGNSLLGTTPELIAAGIPDDAYMVLTGDDKATVSALKKRNKAERKPLGPLFASQDAHERDALRHSVATLNAQTSDDVQSLHAKAQSYRAYLQSAAYQHQKHIADTWCAAFVHEKKATQATFGSSASGITTGLLQQLIAGDALPATLQHEVDALAQTYQFFHWHLAFPDVMAQGGFDCVLGNPPWEHNELKEKEWFATRDPHVAAAPTGAERKRRIEKLATQNAQLYDSYQQASRHFEAVSLFLGNSGNYPLCGRGRINLYTIFTETMHQLLNPNGVMGCIIPSGIATDDTTKYFFGDLVGKNAIVSLYDFENRLGLFPDVDSRMKFCLFCARKSGNQNLSPAQYIFFAQDVSELHEPERVFELSSADIALLNPNTRNCAIFRSRHDAELTKAIYRRVPVLIREADKTQPEINPWGVSFKQGLFNMTSDSHLFRTRSQLADAGWQLQGNLFTQGTERYLPLYEAKMVHHYDHRWATYIGDDETSDVSSAQKQDPHCTVLPRYWVPQSEVARTFERGYTAVYRNIARNTDERTFITSISPIAGFGHSAPVIFLAEPQMIGIFESVMSSFILDYAARQKLGGTNMTFGTANQLPVLTPAQLSASQQFLGASVTDYIRPRVLELTYTAWDLQPFARDCGYDDPPFRWDEERRFALRCELDALFMHLYLPSTADGSWQRHPNEGDAEHAALTGAFATPRLAVEHVMDSFPIVRRRDEQQYGSFRTKEQILAVYDAMQQALQQGTTYVSPLRPPAGPPQQSDVRMVSYAELRERPRHIHIDESRIDYTVDVIPVDDIRYLRNLPHQFRCRLANEEVVSATRLEVNQISVGQSVIIYARQQSLLHIGIVQNISRQTDQHGVIFMLTVILSNEQGQTKMVSITIQDSIAYHYTQHDV